MNKLGQIVLGLSLSLIACGGGNTGAGNPPPQNQKPKADITAVHHIIYLLQENESFDRYFGQLNAYRQSQGLGADVDVTPSNAVNLNGDRTLSVKPFHMLSMCTQSTSVNWYPSHVDRNRSNPTAAAATMDGFVMTAGNAALGVDDTIGKRAMSYYDQDDLPYYYFMATQFAMSDRWFAPAMTPTPPNRMYAVAATSNGVIDQPKTQADVPTIFDELEKAGVSWKDYVPDYPKGSSLSPFPAYSKYLHTNIVPVSEYFTDVAKDNLPQVAFIDEASKGGLDEHPGAGVSVQQGAAYVAKIINALMASSAWKDSVFFLAYDEAGGFYDHVPPASTVSPDGIRPILPPGSLCTSGTGPACDFVYTGFRVPNVVVSPFAKPHYVDHTPIDTTAVLTFIEKRFGLSPLTKRDAAQPDISFFFDYTGAPNMTPPTPPAQPTNGPCYTNALP